jgi:plastocyanin
MRLVLKLGLVALSVLALAACNASGTPTSSTAAGPTAGAPSAAASACKTTTDTANGVAVTIQNFAFTPGSITAKVGQPITFTNKDNVSHGAALDDGSCTTGRFGNGQSAGLVFSAAGTYTFHCPVHPTTMTGTIQITG